KGKETIEVEVMDDSPDEPSGKPFSPPSIRASRHPRTVLVRGGRYRPSGRSVEDESELETWSRTSGSSSKAGYRKWRRERDYVEAKGGIRLIPASFMETFNVPS